MSKLKRVEIMNRASFLRYGSKMILKFDLSNLDKVEDVNSIRRILRGAGQEHAQKIFGLVDFNGLKVADEVTQEMIRLTESCNPYFRATAVIANEASTVKLAESVINHFGKINLPIYQEEGSAKEWLFSQ